MIFHLGTSVANVDGTRATLKDGSSIEADFVVVGVGVRPATQLAEQAGLAIDRGVQVESNSSKPAQPASLPPATSRAGPIPIAAIASASSTGWSRNGRVRSRRSIFWGMDSVFDAVPFFWSQHYDLTINYVGHAESWDAVDIEGSLISRDCAVTYPARRPNPGGRQHIARSREPSGRARSGTHKSEHQEWIGANFSRRLRLRRPREQPIRLLPRPGRRRRRPDAIEELSLADIAAAFADGRMTSQQLTQSYLDAHRQAGPARPEFRVSDRNQSPRARNRRRARCRAQDARFPRPAARRAGPDQGQCRDIRSHDVDGRLAGARGMVCAQGRAAGRTAAGRGRRNFGQEQLERVGQFSLHALVERLERPRRPVPQPLCDRSHAFGIEFRFRSRGLGEFVRHCRGYGDRRFDRESRIDQWHRRIEADRRPGQPSRHRADLAQPGHRRTLDPQRPRRRGDARDHGGSGSRRSGERRGGRSIPDRLCPVRRSQGLGRRALRASPASFLPTTRPSMDFWTPALPR